MADQNVVLGSEAFIASKLNAAEILKMYWFSHLVYNFEVGIAVVLNDTCHLCMPIATLLHEHIHITIL